MEFSFWCCEFDDETAPFLWPLLVEVMGPLRRIVANRRSLSCRGGVRMVAAADSPDGWAVMGRVHSPVILHTCMAFKCDVSYRRRESNVLSTGKGHSV